jgi:hypothetical protein
MNSGIQRISGNNIQYVTHQVVNQPQIQGQIFYNNNSNQHSYVTNSSNKINQIPNIS